MYRCFACLHVIVSYACLAPLEVREGISSWSCLWVLRTEPGSSGPSKCSRSCGVGVTDNWEPPVVGSGNLNSTHLQEQQVCSTAELFLAPHFFLRLDNVPLGGYMLYFVLPHEKLHAPFFALEQSPPPPLWGWCLGIKPCANVCY